MMPLFFVEWMHFVGMLLMASATTAQIFVLKTPPSRAGVRAIVRGAVIFMIGSLVIVSTGLSRTLRSPQPLTAYEHSLCFSIAIGLFVLLLLWSIRPIRRVLGWRRVFKATGALPDDATWRGTARMLKAQLAPVSIITLLMVLTTHGY